MAQLRHIARSTVLLAATAVGASCGGGTDVGPGSGSEQKPPVAAASALLTAAESCSDATDSLKAQLRARVALAFANGDTCAQSVYRNGGVGGTGAVIMEDGDWAVGAAPVPTRGMGGTMSAGVAAPTVATGGMASTVQGSAETYTGTNTQVVGVDEADIVKTDGRNLYVLHDQALELVRAWPVAELSRVTNTGVEGVPREMFVVGEADDATRTVVVISDVNGTELYAAAGVTPPSASTSSTSVNVAVAMPSTDPMVAAPVGAAGGTTSVEPPPEASGLTSSPPNGMLPATKVTVLKATDSSITVSSEVYYDGQYVSARRQGDIVHLVLGVPRGLPALDLCPTAAEEQKATLVVATDLMDHDMDVSAMDADELNLMVQQELSGIVLDRNSEAVDALRIEDFAPQRFVRTGDTAQVSQIPCQSIYLPAEGSMGWGVTYLAEIDIAKPDEDPGSHAVLGYSDTVYENADALVLAATTLDMSDASNPWQPATVVHRFNIEDGHAKYAASAEVAGMLAGQTAQFAIDVKAEDLRLVLTDNAWRAEENRVLVLRPGKEPGLMEEVGELSGIGYGEQVQSVRFLGDRLYVVTFVQTDPLFTIDVSNSEAPELLGELAEIPGFSTYMHPLDESHLLTIGEDSGQTLLQIFDVKDGRSDAEQLFAYTVDGWGVSAAQYEYKAFTYFAEQQLLAIPYMSYSDIAAQSQMLVFHVDLETGIVPVGAVDGSFLVAAPPSQNDPYTYCYPTGDPSGMFQRGVFMDNVLFAVAPGGIAAVESEDPATTLGQVQFGTQAMPWSCWTDTVLVEPIEGVGGTSGVAGGVAVGGSAGEVAEGGSVTVGVVSSSGGSTGVGGTTGVAASE